jgi:hypothetical protein
LSDAEYVRGIRDRLLEEGVKSVGVTRQYSDQLELELERGPARGKAGKVGG